MNSSNGWPRTEFEAQPRLVKLFRACLAAYIVVWTGIDVYALAKFGDLNAIALAVQIGVLVILLTLAAFHTMRIRFETGGIHAWSYLGSSRHIDWDEVRGIRVFHSQGLRGTRVAKIETRRLALTMTGDFVEFDDILGYIESHIDVKRVLPTLWDRIVWGASRSIS